MHQVSAESITKIEKFLGEFRFRHTIGGEIMENNGNLPRWFRIKFLKLCQKMSQ